MTRPTFTHILLEDTDVPTLTVAKRTRHYRRTATRPVQPRRLTNEDAQGLLYSACAIAGFLALLCLAVSLASVGVVATNDPDVFGPDELYHRAAGRYSGHE